MSNITEMFRSDYLIDIVFKIFKHVKHSKTFENNQTTI